MANISNISTETIKCNVKGKISLLSSSKRTKSSSKQQESEDG